MAESAMRDNSTLCPTLGLVMMMMMMHKSSHQPLLTLYVDERSRLPTVWSRLVKFFAKLGIKIVVGIV